MKKTRKVEIERMVTEITIEEIGKKEVRRKKKQK